MELRNYFKILRNHIILIAISSIVALGIGAILYSRTPSTYAADIQFYVSTPQPEGTNAQATGLFAQNRVNSYVLLLTSEELARRIIDQGGIDLTPTQVASRIRADADVNTVLISVTVTDTDRERAFRIAQGIGKTLGPMVDTLDNAGRRSSLVVINIVSGPTLRPAPVGPDLKLYLGIGLAAGLLVSVAYAFLRELLDASIRSSSEATTLLGVPVLGSLPLDPSVKKSPLITGSETLSIRAESFRKLRTNLQFVAAAHAADLILITSALPQEGKSLTSVNLSLSLVEFGSRTLLIDADLRKPRASAYLGMDSSIGLSNVLAGHVEVDEAIQKYDENLDVLPSGSIPPNPSELLGSDRMRHLMESLRPRYDHIIMDTPPILPVADAAVASTVVDAVLLVVALGKTSRTSAAHAARALQAVQAPLVGTVLNMQRIDRSEAAYGLYTQGEPSPAK